jgi:hypothetical protein
MLCALSPARRRLAFAATAALLAITCLAIRRAGTLGSLHHGTVLPALAGSFRPDQRPLPCQQLGSRQLGRRRGAAASGRSVRR